MVDVIETTDDAIASYPYDNLEEGFGLVNYYLSAIEDVSATEYRIGKDLNYSSEVTVRQQGGGSGSITKTFYSGTFSRPRTINGTIKINWCSFTNRHANDTCQYEIKFYHYDGSTSTQIGSTWTSVNLTIPEGNTLTPYNAEINVNSQKFRAGDQMKIEVKLTYFLDSSPGGIVEYGMDPQNRDGENLQPSVDNEAFTQFIVRVPFRLVN